MASMTDIIFLLLIFFMLTSTLVSVNAIKLILPTSTIKTADTQTISVSITKNIIYYVDSKQVSFGEIKGLLSKGLIDVTDPTVVLHVEKSVPIEKVVEIMNIGYELQVNMILATQQPE